MNKHRTVLELRAENVKRLSVVEIHPDPSGLVLIGGENGAGKTSVLDSIMWALAGGKSIQPVPIRDGETTAEIRLDLGDLIVVRRFTASGSTVKVSTKDGATYSSPQQILDAMVAKLAFDPLAFTKLKPEEQGRALAELVGLETAEIDQEIDRLYKERTGTNRDVERFSSVLVQRWGQAGTTPGLPEALKNAPAERPDLKALIDEHAAAARVRTAIQEHNSAVQNTEKTIALLDDDVRSVQEELVELPSVADSELEKIQTDSETARRLSRERMDRRLKEVADEHAAELARIDEFEKSERAKIEDAQQRTRQRLEKRETEALEKVSEVRQRLTVLSEMAFPETRTLEAISDDIFAAEKLAKAFDDVQAFEKDRKAWSDARDASERLTNEMEALRVKRRELLAAVKFPVEGLAVTESGGVTFDGVPFVQASQAQQIRASVGIGLASNPELKVLLIREGALLGRDSLKMVGEMAAEHGAQIWVERVGDGDASAVIIEDGHVRGVEPVQAEPAAEKPKRKKRATNTDETTGVSLAEMAQEPGNAGNSLDDEGRDAVRRQSELRDG
jgi:hypothetical protein